MANFFTRVKDLAMGKKQLAGGVIIDFHVLTSHANGHIYKNTGAVIPDGGVIKAFKVMQYTGEPLPIGTVLKLEIASEWAKHMTLPQSTIQTSDDDYVSIEVRVSNIKREDGLYTQEVDPVIHFDMQHIFQTGCFAESFDSLERMLRFCTKNYFYDEKFIEHVRREHCDESLAI